MIIPIFWPVDRESGWLRVEVLTPLFMWFLLIVAPAVVLSIDYARCRYLVNLSELPFVSWGPVKGCFVQGRDAKPLNVLIAPKVWAATMGTKQ